MPAAGVGAPVPTRKLLGQLVPFNLYGILAHLCKVVVQLETEPEFRSAAEGLCKPHCHLRRNSSLPIDEIVQRLARHSEAFGGFGDRQAEWFDALVPDKQALSLIHISEPTRRTPISY